MIMETTAFERNWAMIAHLTALLTAGVGLYTSGLGAALALLVPLGIYVFFSTRSRYVAFHALQATVFQALGGIGWVLLGAVTGTILAGTWIVTGILSLALIGLLLLPIALLATAVCFGLLVSMPIALLVYTLRGAYHAYHGQVFEYPLVGPVVARALGYGLTA
jgi:uncharacterized Tic20 family protein